MKYIGSESREQVWLVPDRLEDFVGEDSLACVIDAFVAGLDMGELDFTHASPAATGRPTYDPRLLLKLFIYGYLNRIRSSRRLERETEVNVEVAAGQADHRTITRFRHGRGLRRCSVYS